MAMAREFPEMTVSIRLKDLLEANEALARKVREDARRDREMCVAEEGVLVRKDEARRRMGSPDPSTLWRWEKAGYLRPVRIGRSVFYRQGDIDALVGSRETR